MIQNSRNNLIHLNPERVERRRFKVFGLMIVSTIIATLKWISSIPTDSAWGTKFLMIVLFVLTFAWIALFFWSSLFGFFELWNKRKVPGIIWPDKEFDLTSKIAILMPVYNESSVKVYANLLAMAESLHKTGQACNFDIFVLSDTTDPKIWIEEEKMWLEAKQKMPQEIDLFYRRRAKNVARKSGNIEDFCNKWGRAYDYMIVLDADSLLEGKTMVTMARLMEKNPQTGIIQAPPMCLNAHSLFARIQQFAGKVYGPIVSAGLAYWQVGDSNYWGHNAIIRVKAFIDCCGLPILKGKAPFGGHILSHDFVEAALIRRGGWAAWLLPELQGSYEECPPTMIDFAMRDRRWCQGNLQHIKILISRGLHPISRIHFTIGIMSYLSSPIWLSFLLVGMAIALGRNFFPPVYFQEVRTLFPVWPIFDKIGTISLFVISMFMLIFPKFLGWIIFLKNNSFEHIGGGISSLKSVLSEIVISVLTAPIMMMFQSKFVFDILTGNDAGWSAQNRGDKGTSLAEAWARHKWHMGLGIAATIVIWLYAHSLFWWMLPITTGLMFSIPISMFLSRVSVGQFFKRHKYFIIPEETNSPLILQRAQFFEKELEVLLPIFRGVELIVKDSVMNALHLMMLNVNGPAPEFSEEVSNNAQIKLENYLTFGKVMELSKEEELMLLYDPEILKTAHISTFLS